MGAGSAVKFDDSCWGVQFPGRRAFHPGWAAAAAAAAWRGFPVGVRASTAAVLCSSQRAKSVREAVLHGGC